MTDAVDTSAEAVERLASRYLGTAPAHAAAAATLRALLAERDKAKEARDCAIREMCEQARAAGSWQGIAEGKDIIIKQLEAERDAARAMIEQMSAPYAIICQREWQAGAEAMRKRIVVELAAIVTVASVNHYACMAAVACRDSAQALPIPERKA